MKAIVFGASGGTGSKVVQQALDKGMDVVAFVRRPETFSLTHPHLRMVQGDVLNKKEVDAAVAGVDLVMCCIGAPAGKAKHLRSEGTRNIVHAMKKHGIQRMICQASLGYGNSAEVLKKTPFVFRSVIVPLLLKKTFAEHQLQEEIVAASGLQWTIVRPGTLTNGPMTGNYQAGFSYDLPGIQVKVSRGDVAHYMVNLATDSRSFQRVLGISY